MEVRIGLAMAALLGTGVSAATLLPFQAGQGDGERSPVQRTRPGDGAQQGQKGGGPPGQGAQVAVFPFEFRSLDGLGNNAKHQDWGAAGSAFVRLAPASYADGAHAPAGAERPSARASSNGVVRAPQASTTRRARMRWAAPVRTQRPSMPTARPPSRSTRSARSPVMSMAERSRAMGT